jgi:hypothetical protein
MNLVGLDLGKENDPSALSIFTRRDAPAPILDDLPLKPEKHGPPLPPPPFDWDAAVNFDAQREAERRFKQRSPFYVGEAAFDAESAIPELPKPQMERRYLCRTLRKWPLGTSYVIVVNEVRKLCAHQRLQVTLEGRIEPPTLVIDATGLGAPVVDMFLAAKVPARLVAISITSGDSVRQDDEHHWHWYVPKIILVSTLQVLLQSARVDWPSNLKDPKTGEDMKDAMMKELADFRMKAAKSEKKNPQFEADSGSHDDVLMSCCYPLWWGQRGGKTPKVW